MKIICSRENLLNGIQVVYGITTLKSTLPILSNILVETNKEGIRLTATDLDIGITNDIPLKVEMEGAVTIPAKKFFDIIKEVPQDKQIAISAKKNNIITIECENLFFKLIGLPKEEFPRLPEFKDKESIIIPQPLLKRMLSLTFFAMSFDQTRYVLNGSLFVIGPKTIRVVATDGRRMSMVENALQLPNDFEKNPKQIIVPAKAISELLKTLGAEGDAKITISENQALFNLGSATIISRLIEGEFPQYEQVIPKESKDKLKVSRESLLLAVKRASILTSQESQAIKFEIFKDKLVISKVTPELGESREELPVSYGGPGLVVGFNPNYLLDVLKNMDKPDVALELFSPETPGAIRTDDGYVYIVLPMQIN